jgi:hypothetical protein
MEFKTKNFGSLAVRTRYAYAIDYMVGAFKDGHEMTEIQTIIFTSARMALKALREIQYDENNHLTLVEYREVLMHA